MDPVFYLVIGAGATGAFSLAKDWLLEGRREEIEGAKDRREHLEEGRIAALLIADELDTLAGNFRLLGDLGRAPSRPIGESPFLSTRAWQSNRAQLGRVIDQLDTWKALASLYHNADSMRARLIHDGPGALIPAARVATCHQHAVDSSELAEIVYDGVVELESRLAPAPPLTKRARRAISGQRRRRALRRGGSPAKGSVETSGRKNGPASY